MCHIPLVLQNVMHIKTLFKFSQKIKEEERVAEEEERAAEARRLKAAKAKQAAQEKKDSEKQEKELKRERAVLMAELRRKRKMEVAVEQLFDLFEAEQHVDTDVNEDRRVTRQQAANKGSEKGEGGKEVIPKQACIRTDLCHTNST